MAGKVYSQQGWEYVNPYPTGQVIQSMSFINANTGIAVTYFGGTVLNTTNGGVSWDSLTYPYTPSGFTAMSLKYVSPQTVYVTGLHARIFKSTDGGVIWQEQKTFSGLVPTLFKIDFYDTTYGMVHAGGGILLRTKTGGEINVGIKQISNEVSEEYYLEQNYPNPFNSMTNIRFQVPLCHSCGGESFGIPIYLDRNPFVSIVVYDLLGRQVRTLVNEYKQAGIYQVSFNAEGLASGIYFYKMTAGDFSETKKLILIK